MILQKGKLTKDIQSKKVIDRLKKDGWEKVEEKKDENPSERDLLKAKADELGIKYAGNISNVKLQALVDEKLNDNAQ